MFNFAPLLIGAGVGALGGLLTGRDPLKGALVGGATSGLLGGLPAGAWSGGAAEATKSAGLSSIDPMSGVGAFLENAPVSQSAGYLGSTGELGANMGLVNPLASASTFGNIATDPLTGEVLASSVPNMGAQAFTQQPSMFDALSEKVSPYLNVRDLSGAAQVASQFQPRPQQMQAPSGQVTRGQAPQGTDVMALLQSIKQPERRRITLL